MMNCTFIPSSLCKFLEQRCLTKVNEPNELQINKTFFQMRGALKLIRWLFFCSVEVNDRTCQMESIHFQNLLANRHIFLE